MKEFPQYCRNGVFFFDLVNKICGKNEALKGVQRTPKNMTQVKANFSKVMNFFKKLEKMNSRFLFSEDKIIEGDENVIWGFLNDVWMWRFNKSNGYETKIVSSN